MKIKPGDEVRIKSDEELEDDPEWVYDPFVHRWVCVDGFSMRRENVDQVYTVENVFGNTVLLIEREIDTWTIDNCSIRAIAEIVTRSNPCECSKEKFGFEWHEKWCPEWRPL